MVAYNFNPSMLQIKQFTVNMNQTGLLSEFRLAMTAL